MYTKQYKYDMYCTMKCLEHVKEHADNYYMYTLQTHIYNCTHTPWTKNLS